MEISHEELVRASKDWRSSIASQTSISSLPGSDYDWRYLDESGARLLLLSMQMKNLTAARLATAQRLSRGVLSRANQVAAITLTTRAQGPTVVIRSSPEHGKPTVLTSNKTPQDKTSVLGGYSQLKDQARGHVGKRTGDSRSDNTRILGDASGTVTGPVKAPPSSGLGDKPDAAPAPDLTGVFKRLF